MIRIRRPPALTTALVAVVSAAAALSAQEPGLELQLRDSELEYQAARSEWESALDAFRASEARWQRALDEVRAAEASGDDDRVQEALARFHTQAVELELQESRQEETARVLAEAREALMEALAQSRDALYEEALDENTSAEQRRELAALYRDRGNRYRALEQEGEPPTRVRLVTVSELAIDPRDGPDELSAKIRLMELRIRQMRGDIESVSQRIASLEKEQRQQRDLQNLMAPLERFDDTFVPVTSPDPLSATPDREGDGGPPGGDGTIDRLDDLSLDRQIETLKLQREQMFEGVASMEARVETFRRRLARLTTS